MTNPDPSVPSPLKLVGFAGDNDDPRNAPPPAPLDTNAAVVPELSSLLPRSRAVRDPEEAVAKAEADFSTQLMMFLVDYLDARYDLSVIPDRGDQSDDGRFRAMQAMGRVLSEINAPYFKHRIESAQRSAAVASAGAAGSLPEPDKIMRQKDLDETFRRVLVWALAVINSAKAVYAPVAPANQPPPR